MPDQAAPTVVEANRTLRAKALSAAFDIDVAIRRLDLDVTRDGAMDAIARTILERAADGLRDAVKASNDALDAQAFGPLHNLPTHRESRA